jgi:cytochrome c oxidase subunit 1
MFTVQGLFLFNLVKSRFKGAEAGDNPWDANTLEWGARQPALRVYRGPYEYSHPSRSTDSYPQTEPS